MTQDITRLARLAEKKERIILGLMSGTSLDGLDLALCAISGHGLETRVRLLQFETVPYDTDFKAEIRQVFAQQNIDFQHLTILNALIARRHAAIIQTTLQQWAVAAEQVDLIASHGQTVYHAPQIRHTRPGYPNATLQIGDGDHLAYLTGIITISDFRQKHVAAGGEGAPLALYGDYFLFSKPGEHRFLLNIGGIANFTYLPADGEVSGVYATDTGPGNTLLDAAARHFFDVPFDRDGLLAAAGREDPYLMEALIQHPFLSKKTPKSTGPEDFTWAWVLDILSRYPKGQANPYDVMATLAAFTARTIAESIRQTPAEGSRRAVFLSGGGAHHPGICSAIETALPEYSLEKMAQLGINGDAKEAVLFAVLANETVAGASRPDARLGGIPMVSMGKISLPG